MKDHSPFGVERLKWNARLPIFLGRMLKYPSHVPIIYTQTLFLTQLGFGSDFPLTLILGSIIIFWCARLQNIMLFLKWNVRIDSRFFPESKLANITLIILLSGIGIE
jgi:hypothetical protein